jgi:hypothetical protein
MAAVVWGWLSALRRRRRPHRSQPQQQAPQDARIHDTIGKARRTPCAHRFNLPGQIRAPLTPRSRLWLEAGFEPAWSVSQTDCEVPARFAPRRNIQLCHKREHHRRPGATRTRIDGLGHRCPDPLDDEPWRRGGSRTRPAVLRTASRPASPAPCPRADSNGRPRGSEPRALSTAPRGHKVRREGLEPPCGMPDLQSGAVAAAPPTLGVTSQDRTGSLRDHRPALCRLSCGAPAARAERASPGCRPGALPLSYTGAKRDGVHR